MGAGELSVRLLRDTLLPVIIYLSKVQASGYALLFNVVCTVRLILCSCCSFGSRSCSGGEGGSLRPFPDQHPVVRMVREKIRVTFLSGGNYDYSVLVDYVLRNDGPTSRIAMCIPENNFFAADTVSPKGAAGLAELNMRVDGYRVPLQRKVLRHTGVQWPDYNVLWVAKVPFQHRQTRRIRVRYLSRMWGSCGKFMIYSFAGRRWRGRVKETSLTLIYGGSVYYDKQGNPGVTSSSIQLRDRGTRSYYRWSNWYPDGAFLVG